MSPPGSVPVTVGFLAGHLTCLAIGTFEYMCLKRLQYNKVKGNPWDFSTTLGTTMREKGRDLTQSYDDVTTQKLNQKLRCVMYKN